MTPNASARRPRPNREMKHLPTVPTNDAEKPREPVLTLSIAKEGRGRLARSGGRCLAAFGRRFTVQLLCDWDIGLVVMAECLHVELAFPNSEMCVEPLVALVCGVKVH